MIGIKYISRKIRGSVVRVCKTKVMDDFLFLCKRGEKNIYIICLYLCKIRLERFSRNSWYGLPVGRRSSVVKKQRRRVDISAE